MGNEKKSTEGAISGPRNCSDPTYTAPPPRPTTPSTCGSPGAICLQGGTNTSEGNVLILLTLLLPGIIEIGKWYLKANFATEVVNTTSDSHFHKKIIPCK